MARRQCRGAGTLPGFTPDSCLTAHINRCMLSAITLRWKTLWSGPVNASQVSTASRESASRWSRSVEPTWEHQPETERFPLRYQRSG